jgi:hypothetical protein
VVGASGDDEVGTAAGAAYVFVRVGGTWSFESKLTASDGADGDRFGDRVAIDANLVAAGAQRRNSPARSRGRAYVFARSGSNWDEEASLGVPAGDANGEGFGCDVAIDDDSLLVGASSDGQRGADAGAAYVFRRSAGAWPLEQKLSSPAGSAGDGLGAAVAISGNTAVLLAPSDGPDGTGTLQVFTRTATSWSRRRVVVPEGATSEDLLVLSVALDGDCALVGFAGVDDLGSEPGFVYVIESAGR